MDENKNKDNVIRLQQKSDAQHQVKRPEKISNNQTNPMYKGLFKYIHMRFEEDKKNKPFSRFSPKDLF